MPRTIGNYEVIKPIGEGSFGKVRQAVHMQTRLEVAIKCLDKQKLQRENMGEQVKREIEIMKKIEHENIVKLHEVLASKSFIFIVLEFVPGGELFEKIVRNKRLDDKSARFYFQQLCVGAHFCHQRGVCHRDIKPENLLLDANNNLKISDFGLSNVFETDGGENLLVTMCGTPNYVAPEVISREGYNGGVADIWSIGIVLYVFLAGFLPFDENTNDKLFAKIKAGDYTIPEFVNDSAKDLIKRILVPKPSQRITIPEIMRHPWWKVDGPHKDAGVATDSSPMESENNSMQIDVTGAITRIDASEPEPQPKPQDIPMHRRRSEFSQEPQRTFVSNQLLVPDDNFAGKVIDNTSNVQEGGVIQVGIKHGNRFTFLFKVKPEGGFIILEGSLKSMSCCTNVQSIAPCRSHATFQLGPSVMVLEVAAQASNEVPGMNIYGFSFHSGDHSVFPEIMKKLKDCINFIGKMGY